jgi:hypothetical protein
MPRVKKIRISAPLILEMFKAMQEEDEDGAISEDAILCRVSIEDAVPTVTDVTNETPAAAMKEIVLYVSDQEYPEATFKECEVLIPVFGKDNAERVNAYLRQAIEDRKEAERMAYLLKQEEVDCGKPEDFKECPAGNSDEQPPEGPKSRIIDDT